MTTTPAQAQRAATTANVVWDTADKFLRNVVEETEYGDYILPFTVLRRLECLLADTKAELISIVNALVEADTPTRFIDAEVKRRFGLTFYNTSPLSMATIAATDDNVAASVLDYVGGFSSNIADIWTSFEFPRMVKKLADANRLHQVIRHFAGQMQTLTSPRA